MSAKVSYDVSGASDACGLSKDLIYDAIHAGALRAKRSGRSKDGDPIGKFVIQHDELVAWVNSLADA